MNGRIKTDTVPVKTLISRKEAAKILGVSVVTMARMEKRGQIKGRKIGGGHTSTVYYRSEDLKKLLEGE